MQIAIVGHPGSGKTTLFQALSGIKADGGHSDKAGIAVIDVPDERLIFLASVFKPKKIVHARIELSDTVAIEEGNLKNSTISAKTLQPLAVGNHLLVGGDNMDLTLAYAVQASSNLEDWATLGTNYPAYGAFNFVVTPPLGVPCRFYRSVLLP